MGLLLELTGLLSAEGERLQKHEKKNEDASFKSETTDNNSIEMKEKKTHIWFKLLSIITHVRYSMKFSVPRAQREGETKTFMTLTREKKLTSKCG